MQYWKQSTKNMHDKAKAVLERFVDNPFFWKTGKNGGKLFDPMFFMPLSLVSMWQKNDSTEVNHSRWHHIGAENFTLIQACREDVAEHVKLERRLEG